MTASLEFVPVSTAAEAQRLGEILCQCFNSPQTDWPMHRDRLGLQNFRLIYQNREIVGGLGYHPMGQWFGEKCLPLAGVAAVGIAPEHRGGGIALKLMRHLLQAFYSQEFPISTLYPSTQHLYRQVGYEQGGSYCYWELPLHSIQSASGSFKQMQELLPIHRVACQPQEVLQNIYRQYARQTNGFLERNDGIWQSVFQHEDEIYTYIVGTPTDPQGYIIFSQKYEGEHAYLEIWDWATLSASALQNLWKFIASHRSQIQTVRWHGGIVEPRLLLLSEQAATVRHSQFWLFRIVDVVKALEGRGYPQGIEAELHLSVQDSLLPHNNGNFVLTVAGSEGQVVPGGRGDLQLDIRSLAPLYTGLFTPLQLRGLGRLEATEGAIATATQLFAGSQPAMADFF